MPVAMQYGHGLAEAKTKIGGSSGGGTWTTLWTNSDPTSNFAAQTVSVDLSSYTWVAIVATTTTNGTDEAAHLVRVGSSVLLSVANLASTQYFYKREATTSSSGITFTTGYRNTNGTSGTQYCIPLAIYGVC